MTTVPMKQGGLLGGGGLAFNPLLSMGAGLLASSGPSFEPVGVGQGLSRGLLLMQDAARQQQRAADRRERMDILGRREVREQERFDFLQRQAEEEAARRAQVEAQRQEAMKGLLGMLPEEQRAKAAAVMAADPSAGLKHATGLLFPEPAEAPALVQQYEYAKAQGYPGSFMEYQLGLKKAGATVINTATSPSVRALTGDEASELGIPDPTGLLIDSKGEVKAAPESKTAGLADLETTLNQLRALGARSPLPFTTERAEFDTLRKIAVAQVAKNLLGTPGAEPSPSLYQQAEELVPDVGLFTRDSVVDARMKTLLKRLEEKRGKASNPTAVADRALGYLK